MDNEIIYLKDELFSLYNHINNEQYFYAILYIMCIIEICNVKYVHFILYADPRECECMWITGSVNIDVYVCLELPVRSDLMIDMLYDCENR